MSLLGRIGRADVLFCACGRPFLPQRERELRLPEQATRSTVEPRPNAYIADDVGLPQPYGKLAPFKPSDAGSTMRHIRRPEPKDIEI